MIIYINLQRQQPSANSTRVRPILKRQLLKIDKDVEEIERFLSMMFYFFLFFITRLSQSLILLTIIYYFAMLSALVLVLIILQLLFPSHQQLIVAIIGSNDIHGKAFPTEFERQDTGQNYTSGGLVYMASLINIIKQENPGNSIYLDAGDQFQGGIQSSELVSSGQIMNDFYKTIGVKGSSIGNHEFDFGPSFLFPLMANRQTRNLAGNLRSENGDLNFLPRQKSSLLYQFSNGIKIGFIGLSTLETPASTSGFSSKKFPAYKFLQYKKTVMDQSYKLKSIGANAIIILSHMGDACPLDYTYANRTKQTIQQSCPDDQLSQLIDTLPEGTIHGVVQGHRHRMAHHYRKNIPFIGTINGGYYINVMYLKFSQGKQLIDSLIEGPIPICERIFENTGRCNYLSLEQAKGAGNLVKWKFHNKQVVAHQQLQNLFNQKWKPKMALFNEEIVYNKVYLTKNDSRQFQLANLFTNLIHEAVPHADFVIINPGGFRDQWIPGYIKYQQLYNMLPFDNIIQTFQISGRELLDSLAVLQSGTKGFYQCWNLQMQVTLQNGKKGFISAKFSNGSEIDNNKNYIGATLDFLMQGGDDFKNVINQTYYVRNQQSVGDYKKLVRPFLQDMKIISQNSLIDPQNPRLIVN